MTARTKRIPATSAHSGALQKRKSGWGKMRGWDSLSVIMMGDGWGPFHCRFTRDGPKGSTQPKVLRDQVALNVIRARENHAADAVS